MRHEARACPCRRWFGALRRGSLTVAAALTLASACKDPVLEARVEALGPDTGPYPAGPNHRAGAPCTLCHMEGSAASSPFDLGGTVYARVSPKQGLGGVKVRLFDNEGDELGVVTNEVGNFFLRKGELGPIDFPIWVELEYQGEVTAMQAPIFRERSCASCHTDPAGPTSPGHVYFREEP